jgi:hypothetical protein
MVGVRMSEDLQAEIRAWSNKQEGKPALAVAIRRLVEMGLLASKTKTSNLVDQHVVSSPPRLSTPCPWI